MRKGIVVNVRAADRGRLAAIIADRNSPQKHVWRARIVLLTADGLGTAEIMRQTGKSKSVVWRWQERFMQAGVDGLLRDKTRPSRKPPLARAVIERVIDLTAAAPPGETTHWTAAAMAKTVGISVRSVQRIWSAHGLKPHRVRQFKLSNDPAFAAKLKDVVGLYVDPPDHAVVLSINEKSQIQALDRSIRPCTHGSPAIPAGPSTSPRHRRPGSMRWKASSPSSREGGSNAACSAPSSNCKRPFFDSSTRLIMHQSPSCGPPSRVISSPPSKEGAKC